MRPLRRPRTSTIHFHGVTHDGDTHSVTFSINGVRWEYFLRSQQANDCIHIVRTAGNGKAFAYAKSHAIAQQRLDGVPAASATFLRHRGAQASRAKRLKVTLPNV